jgi:SPP1 gp7 family putative phage head morphogenesis protein
VAVTRSTLALTRALRSGIGTEVDGADRHLTRLWVTSWDDLAPTWLAACTELAALAVRDGRWPSRNQIARNDTTMGALYASEAALGKLAAETDTAASAGAERVVQLDAELEPRIIGSQAPDTQQEALTAHVLRRLAEAEEEPEEPPDITDGGMVPLPSAADVLGPIVVAGLVAGRIEPSALAAIIARAQGQIHADTFYLAPAAVEAMKQALVEGILVGDNPLTVARDMFNRVEGEFNGGLTRAQVIARTEMLDAYRSGSAYVHRANADIVSAWQWYARLDRLTCTACWSRHGRTYPVTEPGPDDHQQGRCTRLPKLATWAELGITTPEPPSLLPDGEKAFNKLSAADQLRVFGPSRLELYQSGAVTWDQLATWRDTPQWRRSNQPTTVRDLRALAERNQSQEVTRVA